MSASVTGRRNARRASVDKDASRRALLPQPRGSARRTLARGPAAPEPRPTADGRRRCARGSACHQAPATAYGRGLSTPTDADPWCSRTARRSGDRRWSSRSAGTGRRRRQTRLMKVTHRLRPAFIGRRIPAVGCGLPRPPRPAPPSRVRAPSCVGRRGIRVATSSSRRRRARRRSTFTSDGRSRFPAVPPTAPAPPPPLRPLGRTAARM
jgi:hypothetical protein